MEWIMDYECPFCRRTYVTKRSEPREDLLCPDCGGMWLTPLVEKVCEGAGVPVAVRQQLTPGFSVRTFWKRKSA